MTNTPNVDSPPASPPAPDDDALLAHVSRGIRVELAVQDRTQSDLARSMRRDPSWLSRRLTGQTPFSLDEVDQVAAQLGTTGAELVRASIRRLPS